MTVSRREFLASAAALPVAAGRRSRTAPRIAVVGGGAFGGWTALQLRRSGARVVLLDAWGAGNVRSSSGGETRVIRSIYGPDRVYVELVRRAYPLWEWLDSTMQCRSGRPGQRTGEPLYTETGVLWIHRVDDAYVRSALPLLADHGFSARQLTIAEAARAYPQIRFDGVRSVWFEPRAGALSARRACIAVRKAFQDAGGTYRVAAAEPGPVANGQMGPLRLRDGTRVEADVFVFACGPWLGRLFPEVIGERVRPTRQEVFYFGVPSGQKYAAGPLPIWIDFGERIVYGIPDLDGSGFKLADDTRGAAFDPTSGDRRLTAEGLARAREVLGERFPELADAPLLRSEVCQYENSPDGHLILDRHPEAGNAFLIGGGSGHGFKLAPAAGTLMAERILNGSALPSMFELARLRQPVKPSTQFEAKE